MTGTILCEENFKKKEKKENSVAYSLNSVTLNPPPLMVGCDFLGN